MSDRGPRTHLVSAAIVAALVLGGELGAQTCARQRADSLINAGWIRLRSGAARSADSAFSAALSVCPRDAGALTGRGYAALNQARLANARAYFDSALARQPESYDALTGRGLVAWRTNDLATARTAFVRVLAIAPNDSLAQSYVRRIPAPVDSTLLPRRARPETTTIVARVAPRRFEVQDAAGRWAPLWIKAVNIGAALPGRHPSEFPDDDGTYDEWLALTARMGANTVRVYTIHPPHFYRALDRWNRAHPDSALWLIHGVWTELPPGAREENYDDRAWNAAFTAEMHRVVDLLHGNAAIQPRAGHASGLYDVDVSRWTLGYIIGREWEPFSVVAFAKKFPARRAFNGTYVAVHDGNAVDVWLAQFCDAMIAYEMRRYNAQRPVAYTNWPTLDPLTHPTESSRAEETALMTRRGERAPEPSREYDNDAIGLDAMRWRAQPTFSAGLFASFHAYPYYPDFMLFDPGYARAESPWGRSNYFGYLRDLVAHHGDMPVVISEYGVPSSRGNAHVQPQGFDHGGHDERAQAEINARLTREIHASGAAGAGVFAIIDEWFKKNWLAIDFEQPAERKRLWLNALDAEQNYGVIAMRAGHRDSAIVIDGDARDWRDAKPLLESGAPGSVPSALQLQSLHVKHDEAYVYLRLTTGAIDWTQARYLIGVDTYRGDLGDTRMPFTNSRTATGLEFVVDLRGPAGSRVLVDSPYNPFRLRAITGARPPARQMTLNAPFRTVANADGRFDSALVIPNRRRIGRDGTFYAEQVHDRGALTYARQQETTLADWYADAATGTIELRIPWGLLNVLDPSSRHVLFGQTTTKYPSGATTDGFRFYVESYDPRNPAVPGDRLPKSAQGTFTNAPLWTWPTWEAPRWYAEVKPLFAAMRDAFSAIPRSGEPRPSLAR